MNGIRSLKNETPGLLSHFLRCKCTDVTIYESGNGPSSEIKSTVSIVYKLNIPFVKLWQNGTDTMQS